MLRFPVSEYWLISTPVCLMYFVSPQQLFLSQEKFNQPIFGANNISGQVLPVRFWISDCIVVSGSDVDCITTITTLAANESCRLVAIE